MCFFGERNRGTGANVHFPAFFVSLCSKLLIYNDDGQSDYRSCRYDKQTQANWINKVSLLYCILDDFVEIFLSIHSFCLFQFH